MADTKESKKVIKVTSVATPRTVKPQDGPETQVLEFMCEDKLKYEAWGPELAGVITRGAELTADITHTSRQTQEGPVDVHRVTQIYLEGKAVRPTQRRSSGGGSGKSPEERESIERQVWAYIIKDLWIADKLTEEDEEVRALRQWLKELKVPAQRQAPAPVEPASAAKQSPKQPAAKAATAPSKPAPKLGAIRPDQLDELAALAENKGYEPSQVSAIITRKYHKNRASELTEAEADELIGIMQRGEHLQPQEELPF